MSGGILMRGKIGTVTSVNIPKKLVKVDLSDRVTHEIPCINKLPELGDEVMVAWTEQSEPYVIGIVVK